MPFWSADGWSPDRASLVEGPRSALQLAWAVKSFCSRRRPMSRDRRWAVVCMRGLGEELATETVRQLLIQSWAAGAVAGSVVDMQSRDAAPALTPYSQPTRREVAVPGAQQSQLRRRWETLGPLRNSWLLTRP